MYNVHTGPYNCRDMQCHLIKRNIDKVFKHKYFYFYTELAKGLDYLKGVKNLKVNNDIFYNTYKLKVDVKMLKHPFLWRAFVMILRTDAIHPRWDNIKKIFNYMYDYVDGISNEESINLWRNKYKGYKIDRISNGVKNGILNIEGNLLELEDYNFRFV